MDGWALLKFKVPRALNAESNFKYNLSTDNFSFLPALVMTSPNPFDQIRREIPINLDILERLRTFHVEMEELRSLVLVSLCLHT